MSSTNRTLERDARRASAHSVGDHPALRAGESPRDEGLAEAGDRQEAVGELAGTMLRISLNKSRLSRLDVPCQAPEYGLNRCLLRLVLRKGLRGWAPILRKKHSQGLTRRPRATLPLSAPMNSCEAEKKPTSYTAIRFIGCALPAAGSSFFRSEPALRTSDIAAHSSP